MLGAFVRSPRGKEFDTRPDHLSGVIRSVFEQSLPEVQRRAVIMVLRQHPRWGLPQLSEYIAAGGPYAETLGSITIEELRTAQPLETWGSRVEPFINEGRLVRARRAKGDEFDAIVLAVIEEARGLVAAAYLRARVGGPRWKLKASLGRLVEAGLIERSGVTSSTLYATSGEGG